MAEKAKHPVRTTEKTLAIIEALKERDSGRLTELADALDMGKSAVHNHLSTLEEHGYVTKRGSEYRLGLKFLEIGGHARDRNALYEIAEPEVDDIAEETGERANLMTDEHGMGIYLYRSNGSQAIDLDTHTGLRAHLHSTALGKAILAHRPAERVDEIVDQHGLPPVNENTVTDREELLDQLERIRERGFALDDEERLQGLRCVAAPIRPADGKVIGSISVSAPTSRMGDDRFHEEIPDVVRSAANVMELRIRYA